MAVKSQEAGHRANKPKQGHPPVEPSEEGGGKESETVKLHNDTSQGCESESSNGFGPPLVISGSPTSNLEVFFSLTEPERLPFSSEGGIGNGEGQEESTERGENWRIGDH